ncbi:hypothetical protein NDU88_001000 [Pleurodeles waltl]|uniref:Uncharacterized protein n=1 Tax=Pleurodeles waltl TaxID=8319 RepID=A0AAV7KNB9_PLEWA|nr:hypothetical protein NDU88_001000 [Pleurodeles waltl]
MKECRNETFPQIFRAEYLWAKLCSTEEKINPSMQAVYWGVEGELVAIRVVEALNKAGIQAAAALRARTPEEADTAGSGAEASESPKPQGPIRLQNGQAGGVGPRARGALPCSRRATTTGLIGLQFSSAPMGWTRLAGLQARGLPRPQCLFHSYCAVLYLDEERSARDGRR